MVGIEVSAPAKVILHGEHAVVYGKTAIAASVDIRTTLTIKDSEDFVTLLMPDIQCRISWRLSDLKILKDKIKLTSRNEHFNEEEDTAIPATDEILTIIKEYVGENVDLGVVAFLYLYLSIFPVMFPINVELSSKIPIGAGLGSSAAMSVCFASGLWLFSKKKNLSSLLIREPRQILVNGSSNGSSNGTSHSHNIEQNGNCLFESNGNISNGNDNRISQKVPMIISDEEKKILCSWAYISEKIMHGTPSGIDNSVSTYGGVITYRSGIMVPQVDDLANISILLTNTRVSRNTRNLVEGVRKRHGLFPKILDPIFDAIEKVSISAVKTLQDCRLKNFIQCESEYKNMKTLIDMNQHLLASLGVSHPQVEKVVQICNSKGLSSKLTGAGGGGVVFGIIPPDSDAKKVTEAKEELEKCGFHTYMARLGGPGLIAKEL